MIALYIVLGIIAWYVIGLVSCLTISFIAWLAINEPVVIEKNILGAAMLGLLVPLVFIGVKVAEKLEDGEIVLLKARAPKPILPSVPSKPAP